MPPGPPTTIVTLVSAHGMVICVGGPQQLDHQRDAVRALPWHEVQEIAARFNGCNPYNRLLVPDILKIEDVNFIDSDPRDSQRELRGYAISSKRYALFSQTGDEICIVKASGHGMGYLYPPKTGSKNSHHTQA